MEKQVYALIMKLAYLMQALRPEDDPGLRAGD